MASLTATLGTNTQVKRAVSTEVRQPDYLGTLADTVGDIFDISKDAKAAEGARKREQRAQDSADREEWKFNDLVEGKRAKDELNRARRLISSGEASNLKGLQAAGEAGFLSKGSADIQFRKAYNSIASRYPGQEEELSAEIKEMGLENSMFGDLLRQEAVTKAHTDAATARVGEYTDAATASGLDMTGWSDTQVYNYGRELKEAQTIVQHQEAELDMAIKQGNLTKEQNKARLKNLSVSRSREISAVINYEYVPVMNQFTKLATASGSDADLNLLMIGAAESAQRFMDQKVPRLQAQINLLEDEGARKMAQSSLDHMTSLYTDIIAEDAPAFKAKASVLKFIEQGAQEAGYKAVPQLMVFKETFGDAAMGNFLQMATSNILVDNPDLRTSVVNGMTDILEGNHDTPDAQAFTKFDQEYKASNQNHTTQEKMSSEDALTHLKTRSTSLAGSSKALASMDLTSTEAPQAAKVFFNDFMNLTYAAGRVAPNTGDLKYVSNVRKALTSPEIFASIKNLEEVNPFMAEAARVNLASSLANATEVALTKARTGLEFADSNPPKAFGDIPLPYSNLGTPDAHIFGRNGLQFDAEKGAWSIDTPEGTKPSPKSRRVLDDLNTMLNEWTRLETELGTFPEGVTSDLDKKNFLATLGVTGEVQERFAKVNKEVGETPPDGYSKTSLAIQKFTNRMKDGVLNDGVDFKQPESVESATSKLLNPLLDEIKAAESGNDYDALLGHSQKNQFMDQRVSDMSVGELLAFSKPGSKYFEWSKEWKTTQGHGDTSLASTPMGAYQIVGTTLRDLADRHNIPMDAKFDKELQDRLGLILTLEALKKSGKLSGTFEGMKDD